MKTNKELFDLAKSYVMLMDGFENATLEFEIDEFKEEMEKIRNVILEKGYDVNKFVEYQALYRNMTVAEYFEFIKSL